MDADRGASTIGKCVQFELVGTRCERDAIGARISVVTEQGEYRQWVTAGDGYLCSDESVVDFGLNDAKSIEQVTVHRPGGFEQLFHDVAIGRRYLVTEGDDNLHQRGEVLPQVDD